MFYLFLGLSLSPRMIAGGLGMLNPSTKDRKKILDLEFVEMAEVSADATC